MYALIDSNNFFVSCERLFRPDLTTTPTVVLSSNDGCAISRSSEAKALGVCMGEPVFKLRNRFHMVETRVMSHESRTGSSRGPVRQPSQSDTTSVHHSSFPILHSQKPPLVVFSANFELYGDISERITTQLTSITPHIEVYSVDEAFLDLSELDIADYQAWGRQVRATILQNIGIPVSIGLAHTKTLCKLANHTAKKDPRFQGALLLGKHQISSPTSQIGAWSLALSSTPIEDVWGVGWRLAPRLRAEGVFTALDLARLRPQRAQQLMGIHGRHLVYELGGTRCLPLQQTTKPQRVVARGRQFGADTSEPHVLEAAITSLAARAAHKLRRDGQLACRAGVILQTNRHKPGYTRSFTPAVFYTPTADTGTICSQLVRLVARDLKPRLSYHKAEVVLYDLVPSHALQTDVFGAVNLDAHARNQRRMQATDAINTAYGPHTIGPAAELLSNAWQPKSAMRSPRYTSHWPDLPVVVAMQQQ